MENVKRYSLGSLGVFIGSITERWSRKNARKARANAPTSISSRFLCPRPPLRAQPKPPGYERY